MLQSIRQTPRLLRSAARQTHHLFASVRYVMQGWAAAPAKLPPEALLHGLKPYDSDFKHLSFTFAAIALSARVACLDGPLTRGKYLAFRDAFPLKGSMCGKIRSLFMLACDNETPHEHYVTQIKYIFPQNEALFASLLERLFSIAAADGELSREAETMLSQIGHSLEISAGNYRRILNRFSKPQAHEVLGVSHKADSDAVKRRYRQLMRSYHPDLYASQPLSPEVELLLKQKSAEISAAYRALLKQAA